MAENRIPFRNLARRITGISTPFFGVSWTPPEDQREIVRRLVTFLEDRRALYQPYDMEVGAWVERSVLDMRRELTRTLQQCPEDGEMVGPIRAMRAACRKFLNEVAGPRHMEAPHFMREAGMWTALGELRGVFGIHLARLCVAYGIDVEEELASIMPEVDEDQPLTEEL